MIHKIYVNKVVSETQEVSQKRENRIQVSSEVFFRLQAVTCLLLGGREKATSRGGVTVRISVT